MDSSKKYDNPNPKLSANIFSKLMFWWMTPLFWYGRSHDLEMKDIYNVLPNDVSQVLGDKLERNWFEELKVAKSADRKPSLLRVLRKTFCWSFSIYGGWQCFLAVVLRVLQPYILGFFIWHFSHTETSSVTDAYTYATLIIILSLLIAFITEHTYLGLMEVGMQIRIACSSLIYRKILRLSKCSNVTTPGQILNLLSNDVSKFEQLFILLHYIWILPIQGVVIAYLIYKSVGIASLAGIVLISVQTIPVQGYMGKLASKLRLRTACKTDERVRLMSEIINGIQVIKMYAWEKPFEKLVALARSYEIDVLILMSYLRGFTVATFVFTERTTLYFTIMAYVLVGNSISADKVFSMAQYYNILQLTMAIFYPIAVAAAAEAAITVKRLENFLVLKENTCPIYSRDVNKNTSIVMKDVTASWGENIISKTLHDINVEIQTGKLYAVVGSIGAGKSSFLQLLIRELHPSHGEIRINGNISYASQEAWLFPGNVRSNILFGQPYDKKKYDEIIKVCALEKDFQQLHHGDQTLVGDRGGTLSGGQRARINLARAIYRNADIYLLDDPLSAVDSYVGKHLFDECIKSYLRNKTRILVTHQVQYLKNCDRIIVLNNGQIECQGTLTELQNKHVNILNMIVEESKEESDTEMEDILESDVSIHTANSKDEDEEEPQETEELMAKGKMSNSLLWKYFRAGSSLLTIIIFLIIAIIGQTVTSGTDYWLAYWTRQEELHGKVEYNNTMQITEKDYVTSGTDLNETITESLKPFLMSNSQSDTFLSKNNSDETAEVIKEEYSGWYTVDSDTALWIYGGLIVGTIFFNIARNLLFYKMCMNASKNLHNFMFSCLLKAPMRFFDTNNSGRILNRFSKDVGAVDEILPRTLMDTIQGFSVMIGILMQVFIINWWTIFPMLIAGYFFWQVRNIYIKTAQDVKRLEGIAKSPVFSHVNSSIQGLTTIRSANAQEMVSKEFDVHQDLHTAAYYMTFATGTAFGFTLDLLSVCFIAFVAYSFILLDNENVFAGNVGLALSQVLILCGLLQHGTRQLTETMTQMTSVERIMQFTQLDKEGPFESEPNKKPPAYWPPKGDIKFDDLCLFYDDLKPPILKNVSVHITSGQKIGIVGRTGAGKSSLISALFRLAKFEGAIYIDEINTKKIGLHDLRNKISIIPQEPMLFSATLRDNLDPFQNFDDLTLWAALEDVELKGAISTLDHNVEQGGANFSAGQRQLLCLARAIIRNNKILILDEATANVDPATDSLIQKTIRQKFNDCTVLTIAHRLHTIMDSDKVLVMDNGTAIEFDHPYVLLQNENNHFTSMVKETGKAISEQLKNISKEAYDKHITAINLQLQSNKQNDDTIVNHD